MSRTVHHTPLSRWSERATFFDHAAGRPDDFWSWAVGNTVYDLRYFAGCKRVPQRLRREVAGGGYLHGHGGTKAVAVRARDVEGGLRAGFRVFAGEAVKAYRAGADLDGLVEPDGRTRHGALWDAL